MNKPIESEQPSTETVPKRPRRKFRSKKRSAADWADRMIKKGAIKVTWEELFGKH